MNDIQIFHSLLVPPGAIAAGQAYFGEGAGPIHLDNVECLGNETELFLCRHQGAGNHNCMHSEDAAVICQRTYTVEPPNKGHLGTRASVLYSEVSFIRRLEMY